MQPSTSGWEVKYLPAYGYFLQHRDGGAFVEVSHHGKVKAVFDQQGNRANDPRITIAVEQIRQALKKDRSACIGARGGIGKGASSTRRTFLLACAKELDARGL